MKNLLLFFSFFFCITFTVQALEVEAFPKGGDFDHPRIVGLNCSDKEAKIMWSRDPNAPPDETFVYQSPIPVHYSQEIWFFAFNDNMEITPFKKEKYDIKIDPNRYSREIFISHISPDNDKITLKNESDHLVHLNNWYIQSRNGKIQLSHPNRIHPGEEIELSLAIGNVLDKVTLISPDQFIKDTVRYKISATSKQSAFSRTKDERIIQF